ncbi:MULTISPECIES: hypothetical protein [Rhodococcus]|jgi:hypothetical protein|uniref:hypothetical protein n=1 Tax=Rhodococcus TaxID=1827 RepID=UPI0002E66ED8|nr:hypothetical protein [Rhodococcus sp. DK17]
MVGRDLGDAATVIDRTDRDEPTGVVALSETVRAAHALADDLAVARADLPGLRPLVVRGDRSILLGIFPALRRHLGSVGLWWPPECSTFSDAPCREREDPGSCRRWTGSVPATDLRDRAHIHPRRELIAGLAR